MSPSAPIRGQAARTLGIAVLLLATLIVAFASRWCMRSDYLLLFDTMQSAVGVRHFDVSLQLPHPPGAPVYAAMLRITDSFVGDVQDSVLLVAAAGDAVAAALLLVLGIALGSRLFGVLLALAWIVSPQAFAGSTVGLPSGIDAAVSTAVALAALHFRRRPQALLACILGLLAAAALGVRYNANWASVALLPLVAFALAKGTARTWITFAAAFSLGLAAWVLPAVVVGGQHGGFVPALLSFYDRYSFQPSPVASILRGDLHGGLTGTVALLVIYALAATKYLGAFVLLLPWGLLPGRVLGGGVTVPRGLLCVWILPTILLVPAGVHHIEEYAAVAAPPLLLLAVRGLLQLAMLVVALGGRLGWVLEMRAPELRTIHVLTHVVVVVVLNGGIGLLLVSLGPSESRTLAGRALTSMRSQLDKLGLSREERAIRLARLLEAEGDETVVIVSNRYDLLTVVLYAPDRTVIHFSHADDGVYMHRVRHYHYHVERVPADAPFLLSERLSAIYVPNRAAGKEVSLTALPEARAPAYPNALVLEGYSVIDLPPGSALEAALHDDALELCLIGARDETPVARTGIPSGG
jgi:hypothetical protein